MVTIYRNEVFLLEEKIKKAFNEKYNNLEITVTYNIFNELLQGLDFKIYDLLGKTSRTLYVSTYDYTSVGDFYQNSLIKIDGTIKNLIRKHYYK